MWIPLQRNFVHSIVIGDELDITNHIANRSEKVANEIDCRPIGERFHMMRVGIAGIGFMGWIHWLNYLTNARVKVAAIATPEPERLKGDWTAIKGNFGPPGEQVDLSGVRTYSSLVDMLQDRELDLIDICLPPSLHREAVVQTVLAGKHAFCEKPLALNLADCDMAIAAAMQHNRLLFVGHVLPFFVEFQFLRELVDSGEYGRLKGGNFKRVISDPTWLKNFYDPGIVGGPLFDLHVHDAHLIRLLFGMPKSVQSSGRKRGKVVEYCHSLFHFDDPDLVVSSTMGVINQQGRPFMHGYEVHFEQATVHFEYSALSVPNSPEICPLKVFTADGHVLFPKLSDGDPVLAFGREIEEVIGSVQRGDSSPILAGQMARDAIEICELQSEAVLA
jgi:predicted dehydrogenase